MKKRLYSSKIFGTIQAPASKSVMQRALVAALLSKNETIIHNIGYSNDEIATTRIIQQLGARVDQLPDDTMSITSSFEIGKNIKNIHVVNCGESGLAARLFTPILALLDQKIVLEGEGSLVKRQLGIPEIILPQLNVKFGTRTGRLPFRIRGPLVAKNLEVSHTTSSQFISGLLFAYSFSEATDVSIHVPHLKSKPYIDLTLKVMEDFGMKVPQNHNYETFTFPNQIHNENRENTPFHYTVEADWSGAAFMMVAGATAGEVRVKGLNLNSLQGDKRILEVFHDVGSLVTIDDEGVYIKKNQLKAFHFNAEDTPDLFPPLVALAASCVGTSVIEGVERLKTKESNRAISLQYEFGRLGIKIELQDNKMLITGGPISGGVVKSHNDHRVAMALAIAALNSRSRVELGDSEAVNKSYPYFFSDLKSLNAEMD